MQSRGEDTEEQSMKGAVCSRTSQENTSTNSEPLHLHTLAGTLSYSREPLPPVVVWCGMVWCGMVWCGGSTHRKRRATRARSRTELSPQRATIEREERLDTATSNPCLGLGLTTTPGCLLHLPLRPLSVITS